MNFLLHWNSVDLSTPHSSTRSRSLLRWLQSLKWSSWPSSCMCGSTFHGLVEINMVPLRVRYGFTFLCLAWLVSTSSFSLSSSRNASFSHYLPRKRTRKNRYYLHVRTRKSDHIDVIVLIINLNFTLWASFYSTERSITWLAPTWWTK